MHVTDFAFALAIVFALMAVCFVLGWRQAAEFIFHRTLIDTLAQLERERIILIVRKNGEEEIYSGTKFYHPEDK